MEPEWNKGVEQREQDLDFLFHLGSIKKPLYINAFSTYWNKWNKWNNVSLK